MTLEFPLPKNVPSSPLPSVVDEAAVFRHPKTSLVPYGEEREKEEKSINSNENTERDDASEEETSDVIALSKDAPMAPILGPFCVI